MKPNTAVQVGSRDYRVGFNAQRRSERTMKIGQDLDEIMHLTTPLTSGRRIDAYPDEDCTSLLEAIEQAKPGDVVFLNPGTYGLRRWERLVRWLKRLTGRREARTGDKHGDV